jgi:hypothetical protein
MMHVHEMFRFGRWVLPLVSIGAGWADPEIAFDQQPLTDHTKSKRNKFWI